MTNDSITIKLDRRKNNCCCIPLYRIIYINLDKETYDKFTEEEFQEYLCDMLVHETIHIAIYDLFHNSVLTKLFDYVGDGLRNKNLLKRVFQNCGGCLWSDGVKLYGKKYITDAYCISKHNWEFAKLKANRRNLKNG